MRCSMDRSAILRCPAGGPLDSRTLSALAAPPHPTRTPARATHCQTDAPAPPGPSRIQVWRRSPNGGKTHAVVRDYHVAFLRGPDRAELSELRVAFANEMSTGQVGAPEVFFCL